MAEKPPPKKSRKEESLETKTNSDSSINWPELMLLIDKTVAKSVETSVTRAVSEAMTQIHSEISKVSDTITSLEGKFSSLSTDVTSKVEAQSNRINTMEEQLVHL